MHQSSEGSGSGENFLSTSNALGNLEWFESDIMNTLGTLILSPYRVLSSRQDKILARYIVFSGKEPNSRFASAN